MGQSRPVVIVTGRRRPHQIVFLVLAFMLGLAYTLGAPPPQSTAALMPSPIVHTWALGLLAHGAIGLLGVFLPVKRERGLWLELGSMFVGAGALFFVTILVFAYAGWSALFGGTLSLAWGAANLVRAWQIQRDLLTLKNLVGKRDD
jgi:protein-S-isoprenylcysteine O-methyltransferase Ste14